jgi:orotidine-5'-phosphate decarboxylase
MNTNPRNESPVIVALDMETANQARALVKALGVAARFYKVGLELYAAAGMDFVHELKSEGCRVFLDLKMYDIGETVKRAVAQVAKAGPDFLSIHGIPAVMRAAIAGRGGADLKLLAVTMLTSFDDADVHEMGYPFTLAELVERKARTAREIGVDGMISSPREVARVRAVAGQEKVLVTPGVRSAGADRGDQKRVATPAEALGAGADYVVIGRQVSRALDPRGEMLRVLEEISLAAPLGSRS